jgi:hypothetical protein
MELDRILKVQTGLIRDEKMLENPKLCAYIYIIIYIVIGLSKNSPS